MPSLRLFIAIETPALIIPQIAATRDQLRESKADVKWEPDQKLHATLKFLGNTDEKLLPEIVLYIREVGKRFSHLNLRYSGVGCFPNRQVPRIIWVGMNDRTGNLLDIQKTMESGLTQFGFEKEDREFHPHVTLGRIKSARNLDGLLRMMESITFESQPVEIREVALIKSALTPSGSVYTTLETIPLCD